MQQTDVFPGEWGDGKKLNKELTCIYTWPMDMDNSAMKASGGGGSRVEGVNKGNKGDTYNASNIKIYF